MLPDRDNPHDPPRSGSQSTGPAGAGALLIGTILACAAVGFGIGALVGAPVLLALAGGFIGVGLGFRVVHDRFRDI